MCAGCRIESLSPPKINAINGEGDPLSMRPHAAPSSLGQQWQPGSPGRFRRSVSHGSDPSMTAQRTLAKGLGRALALAFTLFAILLQTNAPIQATMMAAGADVGANICFRP